MERLFSQLSNFLRPAVTSTNSTKFVFIKGNMTIFKMQKNEIEEEDEEDGLCAQENYVVAYFVVIYLYF